MTNLVQRLGHISSGNLSLSGNDMQILNRYCIDDVSASGTNFRHIGAILLLESPHCDEVSICHLHPLAGRSGENVTRIFARYHVIDNTQEDSAGCLVKAGKIPWLAIMNVCQLPLQRRAYRRDIHRSSQIGLLLETFEKIKSVLQKGKRNNIYLPVRANMPQDRLVVDAIKHDFENRINRITRLCCHKPLLVPCGWIVRNFLKAMQGINAEKYNDIVPHPGRGGWAMGVKNRSTLRPLARALRRNSKV